MEKTNIFKSKPSEVHFTIRDRVPHNKLLTNLACSSRTGEYWPSRSVSKRLLQLREIKKKDNDNNYKSKKDREEEEEEQEVE